jgi:hypothetical protein
MVRLVGGFVAGCEDGLQKSRISMDMLFNRASHGEKVRKIEIFCW